MDCLPAQHEPWCVAQAVSASLDQVFQEWSSLARGFHLKERSDFPFLPFHRTLQDTPDHDERDLLPLFLLLLPQCRLGPANIETYRDGNALGRRYINRSMCGYILEANTHTHQNVGYAAVPTITVFAAARLAIFSLIQWYHLCQ